MQYIIGQRLDMGEQKLSRC